MRGNGDMETKEDGSADDTEIKRDPVYYYSREHRLRRASPAVKELNEESSAKKGVFRGLFATRANTLLFFPILIICAMFFITNRFSGRDQGIKLGGNTVSAVITREDNALILGIFKKAPGRKDVYKGAVDIAVSPVMPKPKDGEIKELPPVFSHRIFFTDIATEAFQVSLPFMENEFFVIMRTNDEQKSLRKKAVEVK